MILSPVLTNLTGENSTIWAFATYFWFGLIFYLFLGSILITPLKWVAAGLWDGERLARGLFILIMTASLSTCVFGALQARRTVVKTVVLSMPELPADRPEIRPGPDSRCASALRGNRLPPEPGYRCP